MPPHMADHWGKSAPDFFFPERPASVWFPGVIIVGAGPSGLATAACLEKKGVRSLILEKAECIASLWQHRTYDRLHLHIPKQFCELPFAPFPESFPVYPNRQQFLDYVQDYARDFNICPTFNHHVKSVTHDSRRNVWRVRVLDTSKPMRPLEIEYQTKFVVVASGENAEARMPEIEGLDSFVGDLRHSSQYKNGVPYEGKKVLVVGCGNSGMEIALDLVNHNASPSMVVRSPVHVLPREILGHSVFSVSMALKNIFPLWLIDRFLVLYSVLLLGRTEKYGLKRPKLGPLATKAKLGRTPVLDVGTLAKIKSGHIKILPAVKCLNTRGASFVDGHSEEFDAVILATGYRNNVPKWLKEEQEYFCTEGPPKCGWKIGKGGLYVAGLSGQGILGVSQDAKLIAEDIRATIESETDSLLLSLLLNSGLNCVMVKEARK